MTVAQRSKPRFQAYAPPTRLVRWPFSPFATVCMIVFPLFWPILLLFVAIEVFCLALWLTVFLVTNLAALLAWLVAAVAVAVFDRERAHSPDSA